MKNVNKKIRRKPPVRQKKKNHNNRVLTLIIEAQKYYDKKQLEQANCLYQQALQLEPVNILILNGLGLIAMQAVMMSFAADFFNMACEIKPDDLTINKNLALAYTRMSQSSNAILHYIYILDIDENNAAAHAELARLNLQEGELDLALQHCRYAFEINPEDPRNLYGIAQLDATSLTADDIAKIENLLTKPDLSLNKRCSLYFSLGDIHHASGHYDEAFANYLVANVSKGVTFYPDKHTNNIIDIINTFSPGLFEKFTDCELNESSQPVFIVGMPCSGINLVDRILSRNSDIYAAGELNQIHEISQKSGILIDDDLSVELLNNYSRYYLNDINNLAANSGQTKPAKIINKLSGNYLQLGLIALLFPKAHIIHCVRNPLDVCLSNYFKNFAEENSYSYDQKNIVLYYQQYERLMRHWKKVLPVDIHTVNYENLLKSPETTSRELYRFMNIDWQPEYIEFYTTKHNVNATGLEPLNSNSCESALEHWQHYEKYLHFLIKDLTLFNSAETSGCKHTITA